MRQTLDRAAKFLNLVALLSALRENRGVADAVETLNAACLERDLAQRPVLLCATNAVADNYNQRGLAALAGAAAKTAVPFHPAAAAFYKARGVK